MMAGRKLRIGVSEGGVMKRLIPIILILILMSAPVYADDFQDGLDAYNRKDYKTPLEKWKHLAEQGDAIAQFNLGQMYTMRQDYVQAHKWFNILDANGDEDGHKYRDVLEEEMTPAQVAEAQKLAREWMEGHGKE